ncbi:MAG: PDZ domain-containing protein [Coriobacteriaceae bacterium]|nr:PDZ domain-containing protein [Coriobacteriaceae bacterium]
MDGHGTHKREAGRTGTRLGRLHSLTAQRPRADEAHNLKAIGRMLIIVCICAAFVLGFLVRGDQALLKGIGLESFVAKPADKTGPSLPDGSEDSLGPRFAEIEALLQKEAFDSFDLDEATAELMVALSYAAHDEYLRYYSAERYAAYVQESAGEYAGIGALFSEKGGRAYVVDVFPGSSAMMAGVEVGDFVVSIDGDRSQDWSLTEVVNALSRSEGASVVITWRRPASLEDIGGEELTTTLACSDYNEPNVISKLYGRVGYITIRQLTQNSAELTGKAVKALSDQGALSFVLDMRDNPGGYLSQAVDIASLFVKSGVLVSIQTKEERATTKTATGSVVTDKPLVVLVNGNTAAAAEVLAAALQDNRRAQVVGQKTLGKGSVQVIRPLSFGGALRYTAAYYKGPTGREIDGLGVLPDIAVEQSLAVPEDTQKNLAIETAQSLIAS